MKTEIIRAEFERPRTRSGGLRGQKVMATRMHKAATTAYEQNGDDASFDAAKVATETLREIERQIERESGEQIEMLKELGDAEQGDSRMARRCRTLERCWSKSPRPSSTTSCNVSMQLSNLASLAPVPLDADPTGLRGQHQRRRSASFAADNRYLYPVFLQSGFLAAPADRGHRLRRLLRSGAAERRVRGREAT